MHESFLYCYAGYTTLPAYSEAFLRNTFSIVKIGTLLYQSTKSIYFTILFSWLQTQLKTLSHAIQTAKANAANAQAAASGVQKTLQEREELLDAARRRAEELSGQLRVAKQDLTNTNRAAAKASASANDAKVNATRNKRRLESIRRMRLKKKR